MGLPAGPTDTPCLVPTGLKTRDGRVTQGGASLPLGAPPGPSGLHQGLRDAAKGKVCINLDLDRQMFPFCTPEDIRNQVLEAIELLGSPEGGLWLSAEVGPDVPLENIEAICTSLEEARHCYSA